jgi:hypothetical protein
MKHESYITNTRRSHINFLAFPRVHWLVSFWALNINQGVHGHVFHWLSSLLPSIAMFESQSTVDAAEATSDEVIVLEETQETVQASEIDADDSDNKSSPIPAAPALP